MGPAVIRRRRAPAAAVTLAALILASLVWTSGLDRMSHATPALAALSPGPLGSEAWRQRSARALRQDRPAVAVAAAERAVAADPLAAASSSALGIARLASGDAAGAAAAFRVAGALGWRDLPTQVYWLAAALQAEEYELATDRVDAVMRENPALPQSPALFGGLEGSAAGRRALATRLAGRPPWLGTYLGALQGLGGELLAARARMLDDPAIRPARIRCEEVSALVAALLANGRAAEGRRVRQSHCGAPKGQLPADGGFERARLHAAGPLGWQFTGEGGLDLRIEPVAGMTRRAVVVASALPTRRMFASQMVELEPGRYRVTWRARAADAAPSPRIAARLTCRPYSGAFLEPRSAGSDRFGVAAEVPGGCPMQWLELAIASGSGAVAVDDIAISPGG